MRENLKDELEHLDKEINNKVNEDMDQFTRDFQEFIKESAKKYPHLKHVKPHNMYLSRDNSKIEYLCEVNFSSDYSWPTGGSDFKLFFAKLIRYQYFLEYVKKFKETIYGNSRS